MCESRMLCQPRDNGLDNEIVGSPRFRIDLKIVDNYTYVTTSTWSFAVKDTISETRNPFLIQDSEWADGKWDKQTQHMCMTIIAMLQN